MSDIILSAHNMCLSRYQNRLLDNITITFTKGKTTAVMGHNGAGKTLFLRALHGLEVLETGVVTFNSALSQKMVFQKPVLLRRRANAHFKFATGITDEDIITHWFEKAGLSDRMTAPARHLSSGESQKLALISAIAARPDILFLDEPTANLDAESRQDIETLITKAKENGMTLIMITHSFAQATRLSDNLLFLHQGRLLDNALATDYLAGNCSQEATAFLSDL
ncbi:MAG: ATP-binding cassette domain-containing protein [Candidatus Puniceispirillaceae bacterium]